MGSFDFTSLLWMFCGGGSGCGFYPRASVEQHRKCTNTNFTLAALIWFSARSKEHRDSCFRLAQSLLWFSLKIKNRFWIVMCHLKVICISVMYFWSKCNAVMLFIAAFSLLGPHCQREFRSDTKLLPSPWGQEVCNNYLEKRNEVLT